MPKTDLFFLVSCLVVAGTDNSRKVKVSFDSKAGGREILNSEPDFYLVAIIMT